MMKPRLIEMLMAHPPMAVTMAYMQKLRKRRSVAMGLSCEYAMVGCSLGQMVFSPALSSSAGDGEASNYIHVNDAKVHKVMFFACPGLCVFGVV